MRWFRIKLIDRRGAVRVCAFCLAFGIFCLGGCITMTKMPGKSYQGEMAPLSKEESAIRDELKRDVEKL